MLLPLAVTSWCTWQAVKEEEQLMTLNGAAAENEKKIHDQMTDSLARPQELVNTQIKMNRTHDLGKQWLEWFHAKKGRMLHSAAL